MKRNLALTCVVALGVLFGLVSCERLTLTEQPTTAGRTASEYPDIRAMINATLDEVMIAADNAAARHAAPDPAYATLRSVVRRAREGDLATARALDLDRASLVNATEKELQEIAELVDKDPVLKARIEALTKEIRAEYAAIPTIEIEVQPLDEKDRPAGESYTITSKDGVIDLGHSVLTSWEFLLRVQAERERRPERGFAITSSFSHSSWLSGSRWPNATVKYFFDHGSLNSDERSWMAEAMDRMTTGTGISFKRVDDNTWNRYWHWLCFSNYLYINEQQLGEPTGMASLGKTGCSFLRMDTEALAREDEWSFNHEMGHVFGLLHEHQRYDRKVRVVPTDADHVKLAPNRRYCRIFGIFDCRTVRNTTHYGTPYDYHSVMHYPPEAGRITLNEKKRRLWERRNNKSDWSDENGNTYFTPWDIYTIKRLYGMSPNRRPSYRPVATPVDPQR